MKPVEIKRLGAGGVRITWQDGVTAELAAELLRRECPCAECKMKRGEDSHSSPLTPKKSLLRVVEHTKEESISLREIWGVGQYALGIRWEDGHDTGIYPFALLRELSTSETE